VPINRYMLRIILKS